MKNRVVILGIDTILQKNSYQINCLNQSDYILDIFTNDLSKTSAQHFPRESKGSWFLLKSHPLKRLKQIYQYLKKYHNTIHHVEIYPGGRYALIYALLCKLFSLKIILVERGDILQIAKRNTISRVYYQLVYKFADIVWYKEVYMAEMLKRVGCKKLFFLHNCVALHEEGQRHDINKDIDYLWVNRIIPERKIEWVLTVAQLPEFKNKKFICVGAGSNEQLEQLKDQCKQLDIHNVEFLAYTNPVDFYQRAKYFMLPADVVFANHALLEAMEFGVVPVVSEVSGASLIVDHEQNGWLFTHNDADFKHCMLNTLNIDEARYAELSKMAQQKIKNSFSYSQFCEKLLALYSQIN